MDKNFKKNISSHIKVISSLTSCDKEVLMASQYCVDALEMDAKILFCGNGGSASDAQHLAAEFTGRFLYDRRPLSAIALTTDSSALTCISNDYGFRNIFERQVRAIGRKHDVLILISTSGNSENLLMAADAAKSLEISIIGLLGSGGGKLKDLCDIAIIVPSNNTARIQEAHILIGHTLCQNIEMAVAPNSLK